MAEHRKPRPAQWPRAIRPARGRHAKSPAATVAEQLPEEGQDQERNEEENRA